MKREAGKRPWWLPAARAALLRFLLLALCAGIFALVLSLHRLPAGPALYAASLCALPLLLISIISFVRLRERHMALHRLRQGLPETLAHLPSPWGLMEGDYQTLLMDMARLHARRVGEDDQRYQQMVRYYTLWSHQIKTPLAAMGLLLNGQDDARGRQLMNELNKTEHYVDMALNFMRLDSPDSDYLFEPVRLHQAVRLAARRYAGQFILKRLSFANDVPEDLSAVSDSKWLMFVLEQLLSNALKYSHQGGVRASWDGAARQLVIRDTGIGISPEDLPRVFEQGFTGYTGRLDQQATGIGLYLCRQVCQRLGHGLSLQSRPGEGTSAIIQFDRPEPM